MITKPKMGNSEVSNGKCWAFTWHASAIQHILPIGSGNNIESVKEYMQLRMGEWDSVFGFAGWEICPTTNLYHYQGYVKFEQKKRLTALKKLSNTIHWEAAIASWEKNYMYCSKTCTEDNPLFEWGELPEFGTNGDREKDRWATILASAKAGEFDSIPADAYVRYYGNLNRIHGDFRPQPLKLTGYPGVWIHGLAGSGKSTYARDTWTDAYPKDANKWWCGYRDNENVILEDLDPEVCKYLARFIKVWCDVFPYTGESKGGSKQIRPKNFIITSQYTIEECFNEQDAAAIRRRCKVLKFENFKATEEPTVDFVRFNTPPPAPKLVRQKTIGKSILMDVINEEYKDLCRDIKRGCVEQSDDDEEDKKVSNVIDLTQED